MGTTARGKTATNATRAVRARASGDGARDDERYGGDDDDDDARMDREAAEEARRRAEGDAYVQDKLERELRLRGKIYRAEAELDTKKEEIVEMGLKVELHYYLSQQIHPVISRLCAPIEQTDCAMMA